MGEQWRLIEGKLLFIFFEILPFKSFFGKMCSEDKVEDRIFGEFFKNYSFALKIKFLEFVKIAAPEPLCFMPMLSQKIDRERFYEVLM